jgi:hypothetical protein
VVSWTRERESEREREREKCFLMSSVNCNQICLRLICGRSPTKLLKKILPKKKTHRWRTITMPNRKEEEEEVEEVTVITQIKKSSNIQA